MRKLSHFGVPSVLTAALLSLAVSGQALGAVWSGPVAITSIYAEAFGMVSLGSSTAVVLLRTDAEGEIVVKRSTDSGATWGTRRHVANHVITGSGDGPAIGGAGRNVDVVWYEDPFGFDEPSHLFYRRSLDRASTFEPPIQIAQLTYPFDGFNNVSVARGPNNLVAILWEETSDCFDGYACQVDRTLYHIRVSTDGGASFADPQTLGATNSSEWERGSALAIGDGVIYAAYKRRSAVLIRRSFDGGASWSTPATVADPVLVDWGYGYEFTLAANGKRAAVAYVVFGGQRERDLLVRQTSDLGGSWSTPVALSSVDRREVGNPRLTWNGGTLRAAFYRCPWECTNPALFYKASPDGGTTWTAIQKVADAETPIDIGFAGQVLILTRNAAIYRGAAV
jgi:hypothetical protein